MYCNNCGAEIPDTATTCSQCGRNPHMEVSDESIPVFKVELPMESTNKSRIIAGLLQIFLCFLGAGRFYLGYTTVAVVQVVFVIVTSGLGIVWPIVDGILILKGYVNKDAFGQPLR